MIKMIFNNLFNGVFYMFYGAYLIFKCLICCLAFVGAILCGLHFLGIIKFKVTDIKIQTEECLKLGGKDVEFLDRLPWKNESDVSASDLLELKESVPRNGRAVLLFRNGLFGPYVSKFEVRD